MIQFSTITVQVTLGYDDDVCSEYDAQQALLDHNFRLAGGEGATVHHLAITHGLVDADGVEV